MNARCAIPLAVLALAASGCRGCHGDHPYVPYAIGSTGEPTSPEAGASEVSSGAVAAAGTDAGLPPTVSAPPGTSQWPLGERVLAAPDGTTFVSAVTADFDDDGAADTFAVVRRAEGNDAGTLLFYRGASGAAPLEEPAAFAPPARLVRDPSCVSVARLAAAGRHAVFVELGAVCATHAGGGADRWVAVVGARPNVHPRWAATIADPPGAASLSIDAETADRDGDGLEDVTLRIALEGGGPPLEPGPRVSADFAWLDRPAGLSRDLAATESSFAALAGAAATRAGHAKDAPAVPSFVSQVRALWRAACAEGGAPRVLGVAGTGEIDCGAGHALETAGLAEARAYATSGDALRAALALDEAERPPAAHTPARVSEAQNWVSLAAPLANARFVRAVGAVPAVPHGREPAWGSLAFDAGGKLLVRSAVGVVRVDPVAGDEALAPDVPAWKSAVASPDGALRWIETYDPCDGLPLHASFAAIRGDELRDVALPVPPPLGNRCAGSRGAPVHALPVASGAAGIEAIVEGEPLLIAPDLSRASSLASFLDQTPTPGAPRSPDGATIVVPTSSGLVVVHQGRSRLYRALELGATYAEQRDCVISNDAVHVACVHVGKAWVGAWDAF